MTLARNGKILPSLQARAFNTDQLSVISAKKTFEGLRPFEKALVIRRSCWFLSKSRSVNDKESSTRDHFPAGFSNGEKVAHMPFVKSSNARRCGERVWLCLSALHLAKRLLFSNTNAQCSSYTW